VKPEIWQDEKVGDLSRDARLLLIGLVTLADDEGRLRAQVPAILGHVFPWDDDVTPAKIKRWLGEVERQGLVLRYESDGKPYMAFRHWRRHQRPNRATSSVLPDPPDPDVVRNNAVPLTERSVNQHGADTERSGNDHEVLTPPRVGAGSVPVLSLPVVEDVLARLGECERWTINAIDDRTLVERTVLNTPGADHMAAATSAVAKGNDPGWKTRSAGKTFDYAVRQQLEYAAPKPETPKPDKSKYNVHLKVASDG